MKTKRKSKLLLESKSKWWGSNGDRSEDNLCDECGQPLPAPVSEDRGGGHSELVTHCPNCDNVYIG